MSVVVYSDTPMDEAPIAPPHASRAPQPARHPQLLIVDDNRDLAENLQDIFEPRGFVVRFTPSAREALALARIEGFDLALVDVNLPDASGADLLPALRDASPLGEVVLITGHATLDSAVAAVRGGAFQYVVKPFKVDELVATVEGALRQATLRREREALARQLAASERRYRDVVESSKVLVVGIDVRGVMHLFNRRAAELTGLSPDEALGHLALDLLIVPDSRERVQSHVRATLAGAPPGEFEAALITKEGRTRMVRWHVVAAGAERPTPHDEIAAYALGTDVTDRRALERRAAEAEALAHMGTLAAGLAHEVRNPLNAALLQLHLLGRGIAKVVTEERDPLLARARIVEGELKRLEHLLSDFLELARPRPMAREPIDLAALLDDVTSFQEPAAAAAGVTLVRRIGEARAVGDRERLKQVFHNLLVNALEATPLGGVVTVSCHRNADEPDTTVTIADTGRGIPGGTVEKVFEPFFTTKEAGTGLGLSIVRQIVERHGGGVDLESTEGKGTRVTLSLPATGRAY